MTARLTTEQKNINKLVRAIKNDVRALHRVGVRFDGTQPPTQVWNRGNNKISFGPRTSSDKRTPPCVCAIGAVACRLPLDDTANSETTSAICRIAKRFDLAVGFVDQIYYGFAASNKSLKNKLVDYPEHRRAYELVMELKTWVRKNGFHKRPTVKYCGEV